MGETANTIFTILLFVVAFLGSGAYAVLSLADYRAARRGFWATAVSFAAIGLILGIMTTWPLPVRIAACAAFWAIAAGGLLWVLDYLNVRERLGITEAPTNFPYIGTLSQAEDPRANHYTMVLNRTGGPLPNVVVTLQDMSATPPTLETMFLPFVPQGGRPFVPQGMQHTVQLGEGHYIATLETQDGTFMEDIELKMTDAGLKRQIVVRRMLHLEPGQSANPPVLLYIKDD